MDSLALGKLLEELQAREEARKQMQGLGRPIISEEIVGVRYVLVGNEVLRSPTWKTFVDFLFDYMSILITPEWLREESKKAGEKRHPLLIWHEAVTTNRIKNDGMKNKQGFYYATMTGADKSYLRLAYDLYLCAHNSSLQAKLLQRLRNKREFEGACYEAYVAGIFVQAGFEIDFEDEGDISTKHCEFVARHLGTGEEYSVEAKAITSDSPHWGVANQCPKVRRKLSAGLEKTAKFERIIFIDFGCPNRFDSESPSWFGELGDTLKTAESDLNIGESEAPPGYIFMTNRSFLHNLEGVEQGEFFFFFGFKIPDFPCVNHQSRNVGVQLSRKVHPEMHLLMDTMLGGRGIPSSFDHIPPEIHFGDGGEIAGPPGSTKHLLCLPLSKPRFWLIEFVVFYVAYQLCGDKVGYVS